MIKRQALSAADFSHDQRVRIRESFDRYFAWHRKTMLPEYAKFLRNLADQLKGPADFDEAAAGREAAEARRLWARTLEPLAEPAASALASLDADKGARSLEAGLTNALESAEKKRAKQTIDKAVRAAEDWIGKLDDAQKRRATAAAAAWARDADLRLAERRRAQRKLVDAKRSGGSSGSIKLILFNWINEKDFGDGDAKALADARRDEVREASAVVRLLTEAQSERLRAKLVELAEACERIARD